MPRIDKYKGWNIQKLKMEKARIINQSGSDTTKEDRDLLNAIDEEMKKIENSKKPPTEFGKRRR